jgi:hypothetical protein
MTPIRLIRSAIALVAAAFAFSPQVGAADHYDGNLYVTSVAQAPNGGLWIQVNDKVNSGRTIVSGGAPVFESVDAPGSIVGVPGKNGYWVISKSGDIYTRGEAPMLCEGHLSKCSNYPASPGSMGFISHAAASPDGGGFWALGYDGQVWTVGTAQPYGDARGEAHIYGTAIAPTPSGKGYYILKNDGGVHARGDAVFFGSTGGHFNRKYNGLVLSRTAGGTVNGYWMLEQDGGVHAYGDAVFLGSTGGKSSRITSLFPVDGGVRYGWVTYDGKIELSTSYRRGPVTTSEHDLSPVWTLQGEVDKPGAELHAFTLGSGPVDSWIFWPVKWMGAPVYQLRHERNGLCVEASGARLVQAVCHANFNDSVAQAFRLYAGAGENMYLAPAERAQYSIAKMPGRSRLEISITDATVWRTLNTTTVTAEGTGAQWQTGGAAGNLTTLGAPGIQAPPRRWVVATTAPVPNSTVRFVSMETGHCAEQRWNITTYYLYQAPCQPAVQPQMFRLAPDGVNTYRINFAFVDGFGAAPASNGGVMFTVVSKRWGMDLTNLL